MTVEDFEGLVLSLIRVQFSKSYIKIFPYILYRDVKLVPLGRQQEQVPLGWG